MSFIENKEKEKEEEWKQIDSDSKIEAGDVKGDESNDDSEEEEDSEFELLLDTGALLEEWMDGDGGESDLETFVFHKYGGGVEGAKKAKRVRDEIDWTPEVGNRKQKKNKTTNPN